MHRVFANLNLIFLLSKELQKLCEEEVLGMKTLVSAGLDGVNLSILFGRRSMTFTGQ